MRIAIIECEIENATEMPYNLVLLICEYDLLVERISAINESEETH